MLKPAIYFLNADNVLSLSFIKYEWNKLSRTMLVSKIYLYCVVSQTTDNFLIIILKAVHSLAGLTEAMNSL